MNSLFRPTLVRRVFVSLLLACSLIWVLLLGLTLYTNMGDERTTEELVSVRNYLAAGLADIDETKEAAAFIKGAVGETHRDAYNWRNFRSLRYQLTDRSGALVASGAGKPMRPAPMADGAVRAVHLNAHRYLLTRADSGRWTIHLALPLHSLAGILRDDWLALLLQVLIVFPFIFAATWIAIARGLRPLRELSASIAARGSDDLSPVGVAPGFEELRPLVTALDSLLLQLRNKVSREHAFVQDAAHELRTPLAVMSAQAHVMGLAATAAEREAAERQMDQAIARAGHLVHQLLDLARLDNETGQQPGMVELAALVRQELAPRVPAALQRQLDLSLDTPDALPCTLDAQTFLSVLHNLVDNALKYVQDGGRVLVSISSDERAVMVSVADNGPGIAPEHAALVFERFHRVMQTSAPGAGLGLAIAHKAATRLGGSIELAAGLEGKGCRFTLYLPVSVAKHG